MTDTISCPICGSETIIRTAKKGADIGKQFHVCSRYPECKGKVALEEDWEEETLKKSNKENMKKVQRANRVRTISVIVIIFIILTIIWVWRMDRLTFSPW